MEGRRLPGSRNLTSRFPEYEFLGLANSREGSSRVPVNDFPVPGSRLPGYHNGPPGIWLPGSREMNFWDLLILGKDLPGSQNMTSWILENVIPVSRKWLTELSCLGVADQQTHAHNFLGLPDHHPTQNSRVDKAHMYRESLWGRSQAARMLQANWADVVSNSRKKVHQTWEWPFRDSL